MSHPEILLSVQLHEYCTGSLLLHNQKIHNATDDIQRRRQNLDRTGSDHGKNKKNKKFRIK